MATVAPPPIHTRDSTESTEYAASEPDVNAVACLPPLKLSRTTSLHNIRRRLSSIGSMSPENSSPSTTPRAPPFIPLQDTMDPIAVINGFEAVRYVPVAGMDPPNPVGLRLKETGPGVPVEIQRREPNGSVFLRHDAVQTMLVEYVQHLYHVLERTKHECAELAKRLHTLENETHTGKPWKGIRMESDTNSSEYSLDSAGHATPVQFVPPNENLTKCDKTFTPIIPTVTIESITANSPVESTATTDADSDSVNGQVMAEQHPDTPPCVDQEQDNAMTIHDAFTRPRSRSLSN
jgi:hypothetical protein